MKHLFISYELALKAKELGFNEPCFRYYNADAAESTGIKDWMSNNLYAPKNNTDIGKGNVAAPLYQQVIDWLRDTHKIWVEIICCGKESYYGEGNGKCFYCISKMPTGKIIKSSFDTNELFNNYYEALNKAIEQAFELITKK